MKRQYRTIPIERKYTDFAGGGTTSFQTANQWEECTTANSSSGNSEGVVGAAAISQGSGLGQRDNRRIAVTGLSVRASAYLPAASTDDSDVYRLVLVVDNQTNLSTLTNLDEPFAALPAGGPGATQYRRFRDLNKTGRFRVLYDKTFTINKVTSQPLFDANQATRMDRYHNLNFTFKRPIIVDYEGTGGTASSIVSGNIHLLLCSSQGHVHMDFLYRLRWQDA